MNRLTTFLVAAGGAVTGFAGGITMMGAGNQNERPEVQIQPPPAPVVIEQPRSLGGHSMAEAQLRVIIKNLINKDQELASRLAKAEAAGVNTSQIEDLRRELDARVDPSHLGSNDDLPMERLNDQ